MPFEIVDIEVGRADPLAAEMELLSLAAAGRCVAHLWQAPLSLVVPRSYRRFGEFERARAEFAARGCPVYLRMSGGGLVPQGPGILNLSLAYPLRGTVGDRSETVYRHLCAIIADALGTLGLRTHWQTVEGSFCDGRFNLAWGPPDDARKIAGTAQYWRRVEGASTSPSAAAVAPLHVVLAHAVLLVSADSQEINRRANEFEDAIGSGRRYLAERVVSVKQALALRGDPSAGRLDERVAAALRACVVAAGPPADGA
ncbi:lipoate--protein ligase family protein [Paraburkholderia sp. MMS20-SJTR3]|uniref:Lipoate--protein ligase family protein n=1 Tax=Paraburkholderia sejongensis TaxID=2886946 RepID=A0ABS8JRE4_9BURK|nr:lipoate--protein ligase family protein [Paraburkholderia sp. MMS20-SJTR3]MCC8392422.1 lipoate--protein ligase family protein [Paraburkholderia sp. MMS20-SJTR3]